MELLSEEFNERQKLKLASFYSQKLQALEDELDHLQHNPQMTATQPQNTNKRSTAPFAALSDETAQNANKLKKLREQVRATRILRDSEESADLLLVGKMKSIWQQIEQLRETQGFSCTRVRLKIQQIPCDKSQDQLNLRKQMESELQELREDHQTKHAEALRNHQKLLSEIEQRKALKNLKKGQSEYENLETKKKWRSEEEHFEDDTNETKKQSKEEEENSEDEKIPPIPVLTEFDEQTARKQIWNRYKKTKKKPGLPIEVPKLFHTAELTLNPPSEEQNRRSEIERTVIFLKIFVNNKLVTRTKNHLLNTDFMVECAEMFTLQLIRWPESIKVLIFQQVNCLSVVCS